MEDIKVGQMVELWHDSCTFVSGRVNGTRAGHRKTYDASGDAVATIYYTISLEGIVSEFYDYEWTVVSVAGVTA
jgi:hypothetical protein